jgi:LacI family transcriptional regulator
MISPESKPKATPVPPTAMLRDVARAAGVSTASASRALAQSGAVSAELRARVQAAAERLHYVPNLAARTLAARRSGLLGIILGTLADPLVAAVATACERRLGEAGYGVMIASTSGLPEENSRAARALLARGAQALVFVEPSETAAVERLMAGCAVPWVAVAEPSPTAGPIALSLGRRRGAALAALYLLGLGHRRFGVIAQADGVIAEAVRQPVEASAGDLLPSAILGSAEKLDAAQAAMRRLLDQNHPPTAVICSSDALALAATRECAVRGIAVPQSVSVVGFGDAEFARRAYPALSTVRVAAAEFGVRTAESLLAIVEGHEASQLEAGLKLVVRESTGPAPS